MPHHQWQWRGARGRRVRLGIVLIALVGLALAPPARPRPAPLAAGGIAPATIRAALGQLPLSFEPNVGQTAPEADYLARGPGYQVYLSGGAAVLVWPPAAEADERPGLALRLEPVGGQARAAVGEGATRGRVVWP